MERLLNVSDKVLAVPTAYLVRYHTQLKEIAPTAPIATRIEESLVAADVALSELLALSVTPNFVVVKLQNDIHATPKANAKKRITF
ncbi:unnamed protein product [Phytophthora fragariaefolia]|uniref:Unnamed protein product n=1 Tax=Phytophthora fragariaefolia TaxID=1490495 RepID=A0A9W6YKS9_9STRA|nr:unnamed protein product [Phytophthora fragariaefolia]